MIRGQVDRDLDVVFVGTAAGRRSADVGHYYAGAGNRFWSTLHHVGITRRAFAPEDDASLMVLSSHDLELCRQWCSSALWLEGGTVRTLAGGSTTSSGLPMRSRTQAK